MKIALNNVPTILQEFSKNYLKSQYISNGMPLKDKYFSMSKIDGGIVKLANYDLQQEENIRNLTLGDMQNVDVDIWYNILLDNLKLLGGKIPFEQINYSLTESDLKELYNLAKKYAISEQAPAEQTPTPTETN